MIVLRFSIFQSYEFLIKLFVHKFERRINQFKIYSKFNVQNDVNKVVFTHTYYRSFDNRFIIKSYSKRITTGFKNPCKVQVNQKILNE
jgi:hypothetical protein